MKKTFLVLFTQCSILIAYGSAPATASVVTAPVVAAPVVTATVVTATVVVAPVAAMAVKQAYVPAGAAMSTKAIKSIGKAGNATAVQTWEKRIIVKLLSAIYFVIEAFGFV
ncbi:hypothetical protein [Telluribacter sp.]|jgi:hypothetical protein|uniref:hypothetical protein n=1 Tax=Telluribacter sp. TaxID=1978767 RepID=UPI002E0FE7C9|nr:hypothetical protein [Telluribacter sp.]